MTEVNPLKRALDDVLIASRGSVGRDVIWHDLWKNYGITLDDLTTLDKMENALQLVIGKNAKGMVRAAFAKYMISTAR